MRIRSVKRWQQGMVLEPRTLYVIPEGECMVIQGEAEFDVVSRYVELAIATEAPGVFDGAIKLEARHVHLTGQHHLLSRHNDTAVLFSRVPAVVDCPQFEAIPVPDIDHLDEPEFVRFQEWAIRLGLVDPTAKTPPEPPEDDEDEIFDEDLWEEDTDSLVPDDEDDAEADETVEPLPTEETAENNGAVVEEEAT